MQMSAMEYEESLAHYGILRKSGRYPWGSGQNPHQRSLTFLDILKKHEEEGLKPAEIAKLYDDRKNGYPFTTTDLRAVKTRAIAIKNEALIRQAQRLRDKGLGPSEIGRAMGVRESTARSYLEPGRLERIDTLQKTADMLKRQVEEKEFVDVGAHVHRDLPIGDNPETRIGIPKDKFNTALSMLKEEGYAVTTFKGPQAGTGEMTTYRGLFKPSRRDMTERELKQELFANRHKLQLISEKTKDGGRSWDDPVFKKPLSVDPKRVAVRYKEDGGAAADGVIYVRPGVHDLSMGKSQYAQVRIEVGGTHYLKGMAVYKNDLPPGVDLLFNTNKSNTGNKLDALKTLEKIPLKDAKGNVIKKDGKPVDSDEIDWSNPFGSFPKIDGGQLLDEHGNVSSALNKLNEQGDWDKWSRNVSRQVLSKQSPELAEKQLGLTYDRKRQEYEEIKALRNPLIKKRLLESFSDDVDSSAVHLKAANFPRQATKVLLPVTSIKPHEIFAPTFNDGERVSLVRFPHAGTFEIPELTVNNRNPEAKRLLRKEGTRKIEAPDVVGIHPKVAEHLSGADFDGDTVVVIPNNRGLIRRRPPLEGLKDFDPQQYKVPTPDEDPVNGRNTVKNDGVKQDQMGRVTNLIADMTLRGAKDDELAAAVRHSMVVIDSQKHNLDWKASERENGIPALKRTYQGVAPGGQLKGASTLITKATSRADPVQRKQAPSDHPGSGGGVKRESVGTIDRLTGEKVFVLKDEVGPNGKPRTFRSKKLAEEKDAFKLIDDPSGGLPIERIYATHSNKLKALANEARLELIKTEPTRRSKSAAEVYATEVKELKSQLNDALKNAPLERRAQNLTAQIVAQRRRANTDMEKSEVKKITAQTLEEARNRTGAKKHRIEITDRQWEAIQAGAISIQALKDILGNTDLDKLKERATPRDKPIMTTVMQARARTMLNSGATPSEVADALGVKLSTLQSSLEEG